mgnify:CR=1 FL=1
MVQTRSTLRLNIFNRNLRKPHSNNVNTAECNKLPYCSSLFFDFVYALRDRVSFFLCVGSFFFILPFFNSIFLS